jgi:hypothetical protein
VIRAYSTFCSLTYFCYLYPTYAFSALALCPCPQLKNYSPKFLPGLAYRREISIFHTPTYTHPSTCYALCNVGTYPLIFISAQDTDQGYWLTAQTLGLICATTTATTTVTVTATATATRVVEGNSKQLFQTRFFFSRQIIYSVAKNRKQFRPLTTLSNRAWHFHDMC